MSKLRNPNDSINVHVPMAYIDLSMLIIDNLKQYYLPPYQDIIILCIGTDRSTGDSLGPLIGYKLSSQLNRYPDVSIYGTLEDPVHAKNLNEKITDIYSKHNNPFIIAIDACLGKMDRIGFIKVGNGPLKPGAGVNKDLPAVGDLHITGIVNLCGYMEYIVLQNTRLSLVMKMAEIIAEGIKFSLWKLNHHKQTV
ncbi:spore protease YyaC [Alkaliphilus peptidifermentans]|uniref:Putative sporulation protein YyaC n=1 Tax=Alkaliphilus peptidifermentans DSM 18978 TaxID=1120976 RepID=A0A1G5HFN6_9FIRM|nr:spore protease YyaC [Alkaliphilus peptidifermentans]SCY62583.1 putative sporulation protein YyaC [Alkaliphilus peptidifermentans DSM 18978]